MRVKTRVNPPHKDLKFGPIADGKIKCTITADYEIDFSWFLSDYGTLDLNDKSSLKAFIQNKIATALFDSGWGRLTAECVGLKKMDAPKALVKQFDKYWLEYHALQSAYENEQKAKRAAELKAELAELEK